MANGQANGIGLANGPPVTINIGGGAPREVDTGAAAERTRQRSQPQAQQGIGLSGAQGPETTEQLAAAPEAGAEAAPEQQQAAAAAMPNIPSFSENPIGAVGFLLSSFGAGVLGRELPIDAANRRAFEEQGLKLRRAAAYQNALAQAVEFTDELPEEQRLAAAQAYEEQIGLPGIADMIGAMQKPGRDPAKTVAFMEKHPSLGPAFQELLASGVFQSTEEMMDIAQELLVRSALNSQQTTADVARQEALTPGEVARETQKAFGREGAKAAFGTAPQTNIKVGPNVSESVMKAGLEAIDKQSAGLAQVANLTQFRELAERTDTDALVPITGPIQAGLAAIGVNIGDVDQIELRELFESFSNINALWARNPDGGLGLTGNTSDRDVKFLKAIGGQLANTPEGNIAILTVLIARQRREAEIAEMRATELLAGRAATLPQTIKKFIAEKPLLTPEEEAKLQALAKNAQAEEEPETDLDRQVDDILGIR